MRRTLALAVVIVALAGCGTPGAWQRAGAAWAATQRAPVYYAPPPVYRRAPLRVWQPPAPMVLPAYRPYQPPVVRQPMHCTSDLIGGYICQ